MKKLIFLLTFFLMISMVSAIDSIDCVPSTVAQGGSITCSVDLAGGVTEKNQAYNITFYNDSAQTTHITGCSFSGTTENAPDPVDVIQGCTIPSDWGQSTTGVVNFTLTTLGNTVSYQFNISEASSSALIINNFVIESPILLGKRTGAKWTVKSQSTDEPIVGANCNADILQSIGGNLIPVAGSSENFKSVLSKHDGNVLASFIPLPNSVDEATDYILEVRCDCVPENGGCMYSNGTMLVNQTSKTGLSGIGTSTLSISRWLTVNTLVQESVYFAREEMMICANVTNVNSSNRVSMLISHQVRCSNGLDNNGDLDRALIYSDDGIPDERGINANTTQMQCKRFIVPEPPFLQGRSSQCYASTDVKVTDETDSQVIDYHTTSPVFNITIDDINIDPDWMKVNNNTFNAIINLSSPKYSIWNGTGVGNIDLRLHKDYQESIRAEDQYFRYPQHFEHFLDVGMIESISVKNITGGNMTWVLEILDDGNIEIEVRNADQSPSGYLNITMVLKNLEERSTIALEGIENKTGTFAFNITAKNTLDGDVVNFDVFALLEISKQSQVEGFFSCYIDGYKAQTEIQFEHAINKVTPYQASKSLNIPSNLTGVQRIICELGFIGFGNDKDIASDTFAIGSHGALPSVEPSGQTPLEVAKEKVEEIIDDTVEHFKKNSRVYMWISIVLLFIFLCCFIYWSTREND